MELTAAHLRYLLAIYEVSQTHLDICSRSIAEKLNVTKPSVVRIMNLLMDRGMIVKEHYGKIYLTDRGFLDAQQGMAGLQRQRPFRPRAGKLRCLRCVICTATKKPWQLPWPFCCIHIRIFCAALAIEASRATRRVSSIWPQ